MVAFNKLFWLVSMFCLWMPVKAEDNGGDETLTTEPPEWEGCEDPVNGRRLVTIGEKTTICLSIADGANWTETRQYLRIHFQPIADEYSRFLVPESFKELVQDPTSGSQTRLSNMFPPSTIITVHASSQQALSFQKIYFDGFEKVFPFLTAIIDVRDGVVQGIAWDDASIFCGRGNQEENTLDFAGVKGTRNQFGQPVDSCFFNIVEQAQECTTGCDLLLYVVWTGTDSNGRSFMSSSYRFSAFPPQDWADRFSNLVPDLPNIEIPGMGGNTPNTN